MRRIYKWPLQPTTHVPWSPDDRVLLIADQRGTLTLWAEQEDEHPAPRRRFTVVGTGFEAPARLEHVGSAVCGEYVWHVYAEASTVAPAAVDGRVPAGAVGATRPGPPPVIHIGDPR